MPAVESAYHLVFLSAAMQNGVEVANTSVCKALSPLYASVVNAVAIIVHFLFHGCLVLINYLNTVSSFVPLSLEQRQGEKEQIIWSLIPTWF